jgi:hypothetical protein
MAIGDFVGKIKGGIMDANKSKLKTHMAERVKMFEFIGMEIYTLYTRGEISVPQIEPFCTKVRELNAEIAKCNALIRETDLICTCGEKLKKGSVFCSKCGKKTVDEHPLPTIQTAEPEPPQCTCGEDIPQGATLCLGCGRRV